MRHFQFPVRLLTLAFSLFILSACGITITIATPVPTPVSHAPLTPGSSAPQLAAAYSGSGSWYQVYFTKPFYPETASDRHGGIDDALVADLNAAQHSIDIASFDFDLESVTNALVEAHARQVSVRVVADGDANGDSDGFQAAMDKFKKADIPVTLDERPAFMHNKFVILDDNVVWTGSWNLTVNDTYRNDNNALRFAIPQLTENYIRRFESLFANRMGSKAPKSVPNPVVNLDGVKLENYFSPNGGAQKAIEARLNAAKSSIRVLAFSYTADTQGQILIDRFKAGLGLQGVFDARNIDGTGAEFGNLKSAKLDVWPDGNCYVQHNKVYIIDDRTVITGSYNFTASAEKENDENLLIIDDSTLAKFYIAEFDRVLAQAKNPTKCGDSYNSGNQNGG